MKTQDETEWEQFKRSNWWDSDAIDVEKYLKDKFEKMKTRQYDQYEMDAIRSAQATINEYAIMKTTQGVKGLARLITKGKRQYLSIAYKRCDDYYFLELSLNECLALVREA